MDDLLSSFQQKQQLYTVSNFGLKCYHASLNSSFHQLNPQMPSLDLDILASICAFLTEYADLLSLSLTSSVLHPIAVRAMLRNRPVVLEKVDTIVKFHDFIFPDSASRLPRVEVDSIVCGGWYTPYLDQAPIATEVTRSNFGGRTVETFKFISL